MSCTGETFQGTQNTPLIQFLQVKVQAAYTWMETIKVIYGIPALCN